MEKPDSRKTKAPRRRQGEVDNTPEEKHGGLVQPRGQRRYPEGEVVRGRVVELRDSEILVDIATRVEGTIPIESSATRIAAKVGDEIEVYWSPRRTMKA